MARKQMAIVGALLTAGALVLGAGTALADDNSMSMWTGDSYAYFNNLDNHPGRFNTARAPRYAEQNAVVRAPKRDDDKPAQRVVAATRGANTHRTDPFRDDTAG